MARAKNSKNPRGRAKAPTRKAARGESTPPEHRGGDTRDAWGLAPCHFCKTEVNKRDYYCHGCLHVVCDDCETGNHPDGHGHSVDEHREEPEHFTW